MAASNQPMEKLLDEKVVRRDLYYRLSVVHIEVPPLSTRREDIEALVEHFIHLHALGYGCQPVRPTEAARRLLRAYHWPGNVRELSNTIERVYALGLGPVVSAEDLSPHLGGGLSGGAEFARPADLPTWEEAEKQLIKRALQAAGGQKTVAARLLKINRHRLARKMKKYALDE